MFLFYLALQILLVKIAGLKKLLAVVEDTGLLVKDIKLDSSLLGDLPMTLQNLFPTKWELDLSRQASKSGNGCNLLRTRTYNHILSILLI